MRGRRTHGIRKQDKAGDIGRRGDADERIGKSGRRRGRRRRRRRWRWRKKRKKTENDKEDIYRGTYRPLSCVSI